MILEKLVMQATDHQKQNQFSQQVKILSSLLIWGYPVIFLMSQVLILKRNLYHNLLRTFSVSCMDFSENLSGSRQEPFGQHHHQQTSMNTYSNIKHQNPSRSVRETFPDAAPVRRLRNLVIRLPLMSSVTPSPARSRRVTSGTVDLAKYNCVPWRHLVTGGRVGSKLRRADSNKIDKLCSYVDIIAGSGM